MHAFIVVPRITIALNRSLFLDPGTLGVFFQLLLVIGILYAYCCGYTRSVVWTSALCGATPLMFAGAMIFMPESPLYHLSKNDEDSARKSMRFLRGPDTDFGSEIEAFKVSPRTDVRLRYP